MLGTTVHVVSAHDRRYRSALFSYPVATRGSARRGASSGFGGVLNLGACVPAQGEAPGALVLIDRVTRCCGRATADGNARLRSPGLLPMSRSAAPTMRLDHRARDPGRAVADGDQLLFSAESMSKPRYVLGGP